MRHDESLSQIALIDWFKLQYPHIKDLLVGYPAGINLSITARMRARAMGLRAGFPDLQLLVPRIYPLKLIDDQGNLVLNPKRFSPGLFIEMKTKDGSLSKVQKDFHEQLRSQRYTIVTCKSFESAQIEIKSYLDGYRPEELDYTQY